MEKTIEKSNKLRNGLTKLILKENMIVTVLDLSQSDLPKVDNIIFPPNLVELNLSNNNLECVPTSVLELKNIKILNLSYNNIKLFNERPAFCHTIEKLNLAFNKLCGPPYWVWAEHPKKLKEMDVSSNRNILKSLIVDIFHELRQHSTSISVIKMRSCELNSHYELLETFANTKTLDLSSDTMITANIVSDVPCKGLEKCLNIERLILSRTYLSMVKPNIDIYVNLIEINLSENRISSLPNEFCNLRNLEICILSYNTILYLPDDIVKLKKLTVLCLDSNKLCMLPERMHELEYLTRLDLYDNYLYEVPVISDKIQELDLAQNYFDEPISEEYEIKRKMLRTHVGERIDGRKFEIEKSDSPGSIRSIDEELEDIDYINTTEESNESISRIQSSPEDWDSDEYWIPHLICKTAHTGSNSQSPWLFFVKRKMAEGNFCPMDSHIVPVADKVRYEKLYNPITFHESDGQYDDYSSDDS